MHIPRHMHAAVTTEYGHIEWRQVPTPTIDDDQVLIKVAYAGICGSDLHIFSGDFQPRTKTPLIQGHEFAGTIVDVGKNVSNFSRNERVVVDPILWCGACAACKLGQYSACTSLKLVGVDMNGGFGQYVAVKEFMLHRIDGSISDRHAALVELYSIGFHACNRAALKAGDTVVIWGAGRVGQSILQAARTITDAPIFLIDVLANRLQLAANAYSDVVTIHAEQENAPDVIAQHTGGRGVDVAFEAVGHARVVANNPHPVRGCVQSIRGAGTVCVLGLSNEAVPLVMKELIWKEAKIIASRVSHGEFKEAIHHMAMGRLAPDILISGEFPAERVAEAFELLQNEPAENLKILLSFDGGEQTFSKSENN